MFNQNQGAFNLLFEGIPEGVIIVDEKEIIVAANLSAEKMFGYKKGELIKQSLKILIPQKYQTTHKTHFSYFIQKSAIKAGRHGLYLHGITKKEKEFPVEISLNPFDVFGKTYVMGLIIDVSIRKIQEDKIDKLNSDLEKKIKNRTAELRNTIQQLKELNLNYKNEIKKRIEAENKIKDALKKEIELNELKSKFLTLVSHEFKTPLSGILTSAILLEKYKLSDQQEKRDKHLKTITNKVRYLSTILNDFLSLERIDSSNSNYKFTKFNLSKIINEVVYNANMLLKTGQRINIPQDTDDYILYQDEKILELTFSNLINNAIKYSSENTAIDLEIHKNATKITFKVIDKGMGIPQNDQKFIFNRYFRAENALNIQGTGIGLNIIKAHLENLGGSISFTSEENKGSVFIVELPIIKAL